MRRRELGMLLAVVVATAGCGMDVGAPPSVAEQVAATEPRPPEDDGDEAPDDGDAPEEDTVPTEEAEDGGDDEFGDTTALEAACADLLFAFGTEPIDPDDEAFVDLARSWRQLSLPLAELATEAASELPFLEEFASATRDGAATMRALHVAAEEGDVDEVVARLEDYRTIGSRIEREAQAFELTGCL